MRHTTKNKGGLTVAQAVAHLLEHDTRVCTPLSEHLPFDFITIMPDMKNRATYLRKLWQIEIV